MSGAVVMQAKGLVKRYGHVTALDGTDFELRAGEILAVIGDNGAGKSSLIKALSGALVPDEGEILLDGRPVRFRTPIDARRAGIETVYQDLAVAPAMSIAENLFLGREPRRRGLAGRVLRMIDREPGLRWLVLTPTAPEILFAAADRAGISRDRIVVRKVTPPRMAEILPAADAGLSFIKPCFSKMGSSPTKVAEYLQAGLVAVVNGDIGDQAELAEEPDSCVVIPAFGEAALDLAAERTLTLGRRPQAERAAFTVKTAHARFGLDEIAIPRYAELYDTLLR